MASEPIKYMFILQLPEDSSKNYVGVLDEKYKYSSFDLKVKSKTLTPAVMKSLKKKLLSKNITSNTQIVLSNTINDNNPIFLMLSIARMFLKFKFNSVATEKTFKRIATYHTSYAIGREFNLQDYNKMYKKLVANEDCGWITKEEDRNLRNMSKGTYRIQKILRICMYYMCIKHYYLSRRKR